MSEKFTVVGDLGRLIVEWCWWGPGVCGGRLGFLIFILLVGLDWAGNALSGRDTCDIMAKGSGSSYAPLALGVSSEFEGRLIHGCGGE